jgi:small subunit ribosomal protein S18
MPSKSRSKNKDNARRAKKKTSILVTEGVEYVDWKDVNLLRRFMSDRSKIRARRVTGNNAQQQRAVARAIKNAREMALLPYVTRITQQRGGRRAREERAARPEATAEQQPAGTEAEATTPTEEAAAATASAGEEA